MKVLTANRLCDGRVVYLGADDRWTVRLADAARFAETDAAAAESVAKMRVSEIAAAYLIEVEDGAPAGREALRETIRRDGPTVRPDLNRGEA